MASRHRCLAVCAPGLEQLLQAELAALGIACRPPIRGGVPFGATTRQLYAANVWSRLATRVLVRAEPFTARTFADLEHEALLLPWDDWITPGSPVRMRVTSKASRLYHTTAIAERLARAAGLELAAPADDDLSATRNHAALVVVRVERNEVTVSIDTSGEPLYRRGWRPAGAKAPIRETLAAAALAAVAWDGSTPLVDPFCGSGTIPIEAATIAGHLAPGRLRSFAFQDAPGFERGTWASVQGALTSRPDGGATPASVSITASDRDKGAVSTASENAARAGVADQIDVTCHAVSATTPPEGHGPGWIVTNPPWGGRVSGGGDLRDLYAQLGNIARERFAGWSVAMWVADPRTAGHSGLKLDPLLRTNAGGRDITLLAGPVG